MKLVPQLLERGVTRRVDDLLQDLQELKEARVITSWPGPKDVSETAMTWVPWGPREAVRSWVPPPLHLLGCPERSSRTSSHSRTFQQVTGVGTSTS